jgi:hypothetical protein
VGARRRNSGEVVRKKRLKMALETPVVSCPGAKAGLRVPIGTNVQRVEDGRKRPKAGLVERKVRYDGIGYETSRDTTGDG